MSRPKSDLLSQFGVLFEIVKAITNAVLDAGGSDDNLRELLTATPAAKDKLKRIAAILVEKPKVVEPPPPIFRLTQVFVVEVDKDDLDNRNIPKQGGEIYYVDGAIKPKHFPIRGKGKVVKKMRYLECDQDATTEQWLEAVKSLKAENPDLADTWAFHKANPDELNEAPVLSLCGGFEGRGDHRYVAGVYARGRGLSFGFSPLLDPWSRLVRVLVLSE